LRFAAVIDVRAYLLSLANAQCARVRRGGIHEEQGGHAERREGRGYRLVGQS
jgi:hypothetical protein